MRMNNKGSHDELLAIDGRYNRLWNMQQGNMLKQNDEDSSFNDIAETFEEDDDTLIYR